MCLWCAHVCTGHVPTKAIGCPLITLIYVSHWTWSLCFLVRMMVGKPSNPPVFALNGVRVTGMCVFSSWVLGNQTQIFTLAQQALLPYWAAISPAPSLLFLCWANRQWVRNNSVEPLLQNGHGHVGLGRLKTWARAHRTGWHPFHWDRRLALEMSGVEMWCMTSGFTPLACGRRLSARRLRRRPLSPLARHPL